MDKELKIVVSIFLVFLIFGLVSLSTSRIFATPIFLKHFVYLPLAILFYGMNFKQNQSWLLLMYIPVVLLGLLIDDFSVGLLVEKYHVNWLYEITTTQVFSVIFIVGYFGFFILIAYLFFLAYRKLAILIASLVLILAVITCLFIPDFLIASGPIFLLFLAIQIFALNKYSSNESIAKKILTYQFLFIILMQSMEYFL
ncbi:MAG: hypothetical protein ABJG68_14760 [Crocinitomicaceae bacterium]